MARIRSVHPSLFTDEAWVSCSFSTRLLWIGLWTEADDGGVFEWKTLQLKMKLFPADDVDLLSMLEELVSAGLIVGFTEGGKSYGAIKDFQKYQSPKKPRRVHPMPAELEPFVTGQGAPEPDLFGAPVGNQFPPGTENRRQREEDTEKEGRGGDARAARLPKRDHPIPDGFPDQEAMDHAATRFREARVIASPDREAQKFRDYALSRGKLYKDWRAAWRQWVANAVDYATRDGKVINIADHAPDPEFENRKFRTWMQDWIAKPYQWREHERGPPPNQPGCRIPTAIMAEFDFTPPRAASR